MASTPGGPTAAAPPAAALDVASRTAPGPLAVRRPDGRSAPWIHVDYSGAIWLHTRRLGSIRIGDAQPVEASLREALAETGSNTVLIETAPQAPRETVARLLEAAKRAGATDRAVTVMAPIAPLSAADPRPMRRSSDDLVVTVTQVRQLYLGPTHLPPQDLERALRRALERSSRGVVLFQLDGAVDRGSIDDLLVVARRAGAREVGVLEEPTTPTSADGRPFKDGIKETIEAHSREIRACYERHLQQSRSDGGRLNFRWMIAPTGEASQVTWSGPELGELGPCVRDVLTRTRFPALRGIKGPLLVAYPFFFQPGP